MAAPRPQHPPLCETDSAASDPRDVQQPYDLKGKSRAYDHTQQAGLSISSAAPLLAPHRRCRRRRRRRSRLDAARRDFGQDELELCAALRVCRRHRGMCGQVGHRAARPRQDPVPGAEPRSETSGRLFLAGSASGVLSVFLTYPLELIRVRLAFETKRKRQKGGVRRIIRMIYSEGATEAPFSSDARRRAARMAQTAQQANLSTAATSASASALGSALRATDPNVPSAAVPAGNRLLAQYPVLKFYRGFSVTVMGMIPYAGTSFLVFGRCKTMLQDLFPPSEPAADVPGSRRRWFWPSKTVVDLSAGALAGALSQTAAYPFEVIRRRQQVGGIIRPGAMLGMGETAAWIYKTSGWRGFYVGLSIGFLKVVPMTSISFAVWLGMKRQMGI
ncbi:hypothetical protein L1887_48815 [Cichorium endivia]|nr:hypothetical protein L1887_48815 [Cichorium endivia]